MTNKKKIYVIVLNYNNESDTIECINSLDSITEFDLEIVVVDNNSKDAKLLNNFVSNISNAVFHQAGENRGYAAGNNVGLRFALNNSADYIAILNNDVIVNRDSFSESISMLDNNPHAAFVSPTLLNYKSDIIQSQGVFLNFWGLNLIKNLGIDKQFIPQEGFIECHSIVGACMLFKPSIIDKIGLLPEEYFLNFEETDWCYKAVQHGMKNYCSLKSYVNHKGSATINCYSNLSFYYYNRNIIIFLLKRDPIKLRAAYSIALLFVKAIVKMLIGYKGKQTNKQTNKHLLLCYVDGLLRTTRFKDFICSGGLKKKK